MKMERRRSWFPRATGDAKETFTMDDGKHVLDAGEGVTEIVGGAHRYQSARRSRHSLGRAMVSTAWALIPEPAH